MSQKPSYEELAGRVRELEEDALARRRTNEVLRKSEERYRMLFNYSPLGIVHFDCDGLIVDCNERFLEIVGAPRERLLGFNMATSLRNEEMRAAVIAGLSGEPNYFEGDYRSVTANKVTPIRAMFSRVNTDDGGFMGAVGLFEDVSAQKQSEEALQESREFLGKIVASISDPIFVKDRDHRLILVNEAECALAGKTREEILGRTDYDFFPKEQVDIFWEKDEAVFETGEENENEEQITDGQGRTRTIVTKKSLYTDSFGNKFIVGVIRDITDRKEAELALQAAHQELQDIIEFLPDATLVIDRDKKVTYWNRAIEEMTGVRKSDILGKGDYAYANAFYAKRRPMLIDLVMAEEPEIESRYDFVKRIGTTVYGEAYVPGAYRGKGAHLWSTAAPLIGRDGNIVGFIQSIRDISERKRAEEALKENEKKYRQLFETVSDAILVCDGDSRRLIDVNERALSLYGYSREEFLDLSYRDITAETDESDVVIRETLSGVGVQVPLRTHRKKDGTLFPAEISSSTFELAGRKVICGVVRDITERKRVERELSAYRDGLEHLIEARTAELARTNERLKVEIEERRRAKERLKLFAYSVAHDLKSPAVGIHGIAKRLHRQTRDVLDEKSRSYCSQILKVSEHIAELVDKINVYIATKEARLSFERIALKEILAMLRDEFSVQFNSRRIEWDLPESDVVVTADRLSLLRVFRNLVDNALKYGGEHLSRIRIGYEEGKDCHILTVADNGRGLRGADSERIFEVFQRQETSKGVEGAGLGLTIVREIAEQHNGRVWMEPVPNGGASFFVTISKDLPVS